MKLDYTYPHRLHGRSRRAAAGDALGMVCALYILVPVLIVVACLLSFIF